jgi:DNA-binding protein HU-beta
MTVFANKDLYEVYAEKKEMGKGEAEKHLKDTFATLSEIVKEYGMGFKLGDFGTFDVGVKPERAARKGRNPQTGEEIDIASVPAHNALKFKASEGEKSVKKALKALEV